jgi:transcription elongation factor Elf1
MSKKKARKKIIKVVQPKVPTIFDCPFCNYKKCVDVKIDRKKRIASLKCKVCQSSYETTLNHLTEPVDVYYNWIDECERENMRKDKEEKEERDSAEYDE